MYNQGWTCTVHVHVYMYTVLVQMYMCIAVQPHCVTFKLVHVHVHVGMMSVLTEWRHGLLLGWGTNWALPRVLTRCLESSLVTMPSLCAHTYEEPSESTRHSSFREWRMTLSLCTTSSRSVLWLGQERESVCFNLYFCSIFRCSTARPLLIRCAPNWTSLLCPVPSSGPDRCERIYYICTCVHVLGF